MSRFWNTTCNDFDSIYLYKCLHSRKQMIEYNFREKKTVCDLGKGYLPSRSDRSRETLKSLFSPLASGLVNPVVNNKCNNLGNPQTDTYVHFDPFKTPAPELSTCGYLQCVWDRNHHIIPGKFCKLGMFQLK